MWNPRAIGPAVVLFVTVALTCRVAAAPVSDEPITVHEWGTFTALQDDDGSALGAINADDEPVPYFVCGTGGVYALPADSPLSPRLKSGYSKGIVTCHPGVTLRLETPVVYFYPPVAKAHASVDVRVTFRGGWLTEFYPLAEANTPGLHDGPGVYPSLTDATRGSLTWNHVELNAPGPLTVTDDPVWTAPREVPGAATVKVPGSSGGADSPSTRPEKFLFYRGVGHLDSPLRAVRNPQTDQLSLYPAVAAEVRQQSETNKTDLHVPAAWLIEIRPEDGQCAFRAVAGDLDLRSPAGQPFATLPASFGREDFRPARLRELREAMQKALVAAGLFPDEAAAMLKTWELSYFKNPGRRLFYVTPRVWTDAVLPLTISGANTSLSRVMIGRIELVTPAQRDRLARIAAGPCPDLTTFARSYMDGLNQSIARHEADTGQASTAAPWKQPALAELGIAVPTLYNDYLALGRFRDALVLHEQQRRPTAALAEFITANTLQIR